MSPQLADDGKGVKGVVEGAKRGEVGGRGREGEGRRDEEEAHVGACCEAEEDEERGVDECAGVGGGAWWGELGWRCGWEGYLLCGGRGGGRRSR